MKNTTLIIRNEEEKDYFSTENLTREAFWNVYLPGAKEHYVLHCLINIHPQSGWFYIFGHSPCLQATHKCVFSWPASHALFTCYP